RRGGGRAGLRAARDRGVGLPVRAGGRGGRARDRRRQRLHRGGGRRGRAAADRSGDRAPPARADGSGAGRTRRRGGRDCAGGSARYGALTRRAARAARTFRPDVVYAHFLAPAGLIAALSSRAPLVVTAHGQDVRNIGVIPGVAAATRYVVGRAAAVIAVSAYLRGELEAKIPAARGKTE